MAINSNYYSPAGRPGEVDNRPPLSEHNKHLKRCRQYYNVSNVCNTVAKYLFGGGIVLLGASFLAAHLSDREFIKYNNARNKFKKEV